MLIDRMTASRLGLETLEILDRGGYTNPSGEHVDLRQWLQRAVDGTRSYPPEAPLARVVSSQRSATFSTANISTLDAAERFAREGRAVAALNFASANNPGGGFLSGARAQEESLARASGLYACLRDQPMYEFHRAQRDPLYSAWVLYSPDVPVFRTNAGVLLEQPWTCAFITCPAVNAGVVLERDPSRRGEIRRAMTERIDRVLTVAAVHERDALVLGAWGCGVFGNDPDEIAALFQAALSGPFAGVFEHVTFAILDWRPNQPVIRPFANRFGP